MATAHRLARIIYDMSKNGQPYAEAEAFKVTPSSQARRLQTLHQPAHALGFQLVPTA